MDKIIIKGLEVFAKHGVLPSEKELEQRFVINCELNLDLRNAGESDDLSQTVNYAEVCQSITKIMRTATYNLIESCAQKVSNHILYNYNVNSVKVTIEKPWAPIGMSGNVSVEIVRAWHRVYLGLGSNMGDTTANLNNAIKEMECSALQVIRCSGYHKTKPVSDIPQDDYLNCVAEVRSTFTTGQLIDHLMAVEARLGRERSQPWGPRTIDIDILTYDDIVSDRANAVIPHPHMHNRLFVLVPFCELNPYYVHPLLGKRVYELKAELEKKGKEL